MKTLEAKQEVNKKWLECLNKFRDRLNLTLRISIEKEHYHVMNVTKETIKFFNKCFGEAEKEMSDEWNTTKGEEEMTAEKELIEKYSRSEINIVEKHNPSCYGHFICTDAVRIIIKKVRQETIYNFVKEMLEFTSSMETTDDLTLIVNKLEELGKEGVKE